jgi:hypothetical protein
VHPPADRAHRGPPPESAPRSFRAPQGRLVQIC